MLVCSLERDPGGGHAYAIHDHPKILPVQPEFNLNCIDCLTEI